MRASISAIPARPSLRRTAYTGRARKRREFSRPMFSGLGMDEEEEEEVEVER